MTAQPIASIEHHFADLDDLRDTDHIDYPLVELVVLTICAVVSGANCWTEVEQFGQGQAAWLRQFLALPNGIPSHDTLWRVFRHLDAQQFEECFARWTAAVCQVSEGEIVAIDGKQCRRSHDRPNDQAALCLVSAWAAENHLTLGQVKTEADSNEITAIPALLDLLDLHGCIVTIDAMGCQVDIAQTIIEEGGDYILALKDNQGRLHEDAVELFDDLDRCPEAYACDTARQVDTDHGRVMVRHSWVVRDPAVLSQIDSTHRWPQLCSLIKVRTEQYLPDQEPQVGVRYFISSLDQGAQTVLESVRTHWHIENRLHWVMDVAFREDDSRLRKDHGAHNFAIVRRIAHNLLRQDETLNVGIEGKRKRAGWDSQFRLQVLSTLFT